MNAQRDDSKFRRGSGVYTCRCCGHRTRETGHCESGVELCALCYEIGGLENQISDGHDEDGKAAVEMARLEKLRDDRNAKAGGR